jgi:hypothetical protein
LDIFGNAPGAGLAPVTIVTVTTVTAAIIICFQWQAV